MSHHEKWLKRQLELQATPVQTGLVQPLDQWIIDEAGHLPVATYFEIDSALEHASARGGMIACLHQGYAQGHFTPYDVVCYYLRRIGLYNKTLNAFTQLAPWVLNEAAALDYQSATNCGQKLLPPLWGIPIALKDNIATGDDMANTAGAYALLGATTSRPASIVAKIEDQGGLIIGKANLSEWANFMTIDSSNGYSTLGGQTRNPYGAFDVGGSSSGSCVAVAAGLVPVAVGTETAGSLVYPASQNNVVAIKPTVGLVSRDLIIPISSTQDTAGPVANCVRDAAKLLSAMSGRCCKDEKTQGLTDQTLNYEQSCGTSIKGLKIGLVANAKILEDYRDNDGAIIERAKNTFDQLGVQVVDIDMNDLALAIDSDMYTVLLYEFYRDVNAYLCHPDVHNDLELTDIVRYNAKAHKSRAAYGQVLLENAINEKPAFNKYQSVLKTNVLRASTAIYGALKEVDALLSISNYATILYATAGYPAISVPAGHRPTGEPVGITLFAGAFEEQKLIALAHAFEQATEYRQLPTLLI